MKKRMVLLGEGGWHARLADCHKGTSNIIAK